MKFSIKQLSVAITMSILSISTAYADGLPNPGMEYSRGNTAVVITDPQVDFLSPKGVTWGVVGESVTKNNTVENLESLMKTAKKKDIPLFISPHYYYPHDHKWQHQGSLEVLMHNINMFDRKDALSLDGFKNSGADWLPKYKKYINDGETIVTSPHKMYGPDSNDLVLQLRKRGIGKVILAGMSSNLCTESHLRELMEQGFEVQVVSDATAGAILPGMNAYEASLINFRMIANSVRNTKETVKLMTKI